MDSLTSLAASGLRSRMESLDLLASNIANNSTGGYKADREFYTLYASPEAADTGMPATMPLIERPWIDLSPGLIQSTGNQLDVALSGEGFLTVQGPNGTLYTRNGNLRLAGDGKLVTPDGYPVRSTSGTPLTLQATRPVDISADGTVSQDGNVVGQLDIADLPPAAITKQGSNYMRVSNASAAIGRPAGTTVEQGKLESSNAASAESAVRLVSVMRQFEMLQKAAALGAEMNQHAIEEVAKV